MGRTRTDFKGVKHPAQNEKWRKVLGKNVAYWRLARGLSQQSLANRTSTNRPMISKIELGNTIPSAEHLIEIAAALSIELRDIVPAIPAAFELSHDEARELIVKRLSHVRQDLEDIEELAIRLTRPDPIRDPRLDSGRRARNAARRLEEYSESAGDD